MPKYTEEEQYTTIAAHDWEEIKGNIIGLRMDTKNALDFMEFRTVTDE